MQFIIARKLSTTAYHPLTNGQFLRYKCTLVERFRNYVSEQQKGWDTYVQPLTYAYSAQTRIATETSPFTVIFLWELPSAALFDRVAGLKNYMQCDVTQLHKPHSVLEKINLIKAAVSSRLSPTEDLYEGNFDKNVQRGLTFKVGNYVFIYRAQFAVLTSDPAYDMASRWSKKLLPRTSEPDTIIGLQQRAVSIGGDINLNFVSIECTTLLRTRSQVTNNLPETAKITRPHHESQQWQKAIKDAKKTTKGDATVPLECVERCLMCHVDTPQGIGHVLRWYVAGPGDHTLELSYHTVMHIARRYWNSLTRKGRHTRPNWTAGDNSIVDNLHWSGGRQ